MAASDPILLPFLDAPTEAEAQERLGALLSLHAAPLIRQTVGGALRPGSGGTAAGRQDVEDICAEVMLKLVTRLQECRREPTGAPLASFRAYVAVSSYNASYEYLRARRPGRSRIKNRLRYLLSRDQTFVIWEAADRQWLCVLAGRQRPAVAGVPLADLRSRLDRNPPDAALGLPAFARYVLEVASGPVGLDDLVELASLHEGADQESSDASLAPASQATLEMVPDPRASVAVEIDQRRYLQALWHELQELPVRQRLALLLNLRDGSGRGAIGLLPVIGVASIRQIAAALELPAQELAALWPTLPLDDDAIAARLALTRQQVINLRKSARARLARRLRGLDSPLAG